MKHICSFIASVPQTNSAIKAGGDTCRITIEVPKSDKLEALRIIALDGMVFRVTIEVEDE